jgi:endoglucanase
VLTATRLASRSGQFDDHGIGWVACWFDDEWEPPMFTKGWKAPTNYGTFVLEKLKE